MAKFELWTSDLRNCWWLLITFGLYKIVSGGCMVSGYSYYDSKHTIIMGMVVLLTRDPQLSKSISVVDRIAISYWIWLPMSLLGYGTINWDCIIRLWLIVWYLMNVLGIHTAGRSCVMAYKSQTSWEGFPLQMGFEWNTIGHFENVSSALHVW